MDWNDGNYKHGAVGKKEQTAKLALILALYSIIYTALTPYLKIYRPKQGVNPSWILPFSPNK